MSEHAPSHQSPEHHTPSHEHVEHAAHHEQHTHKEHSEKHGSTEHVTDLQTQIEQLAISGKETASTSVENPMKRPSFIGREMKAMALERLLARAQRKLNRPERVLGKALHNPIVDRISEVGSRTVARPSGILGGGIFAFVGSLVFYWISKHYGFEYNYSTLLIMFVGGFFLGMIVELGWYSWKRKHL